MGQKHLAYLMLTYYTIWHDRKRYRNTIVYLCDWVWDVIEGLHSYHYILFYNLNCIFLYFNFWGHKVHIMFCSGGGGYSSIVNFRYYYIILWRGFVTLVSWTKYNVVLIQPGKIVYIITYFNTIYYNMHIIFNILGILIMLKSGDELETRWRWLFLPSSFFSDVLIAPLPTSPLPRPTHRRLTHSSSPTCTQRTRLNINCDHPVSKRWSETNTVAAREDKTF